MLPMHSDHDSIPAPSRAAESTFMKSQLEKSSSSNGAVASTVPQPAVPQLKPLARSILAWARRPAAWSLALGTMPVLALAQPTGGAVVAGSATISAPDANHTVIQQASDKAIINWQAFSIGQQGYVQFVQPGRGSITLNRVVGSDPSAILGHLSSNGQIFLVNPHGVFFGANATVDVAGIVATTLDIDNDDFMRGDYRFFRSPNAPAGATVINNGTINANGGYVVLAGDYAANKGIVQAQLGTVLLASGDALTLQLAGSSLINYEVDQATVAHLAGVENAGQILANGGRVIMTADVANDLASTVVNNSGLVQAQSTVEKDGAVYFEGQGGNVVNSGTVDASAQAGANGGHVDIHASGDIDHEAGSTIDVSGADTGSSNAGSLTTWADGSNNFKAGAAIAARGGAEGGDGGQVELSGNQVVNRSIVDLRAPNGQLGTLTLDPNTITIADGAGTDDDTSSANTGAATIYEQNLENQLKTANVALSATGANASITVANLSDGVLDGTNNGSGGSLSMTASGANSSISFANTADTIKVDGSLTLKADDGSGGYTGTSIHVGNLVAGQGTPTGGGLNNTATWTSSLNVDAGSISATSLTLGKAITTNTDAVYNLDAHAHDGDLAVDGDVTVDVANSAVGSVQTSTTLQSDTGNVTVTGDVTSNASGQGYHEYDWSTPGAAATTYYNQQPWTQTGEADHPITTNLAIQAGGSVNVGGATSAQATDAGTGFQSGDTMGGYWQTANATQHIFWRATAPQATATVTAGGDATFGGAVDVKADGYVTQSYGETESWDEMVQQWNTTSASQTVHTWECLSADNCGYFGQYTATTSTQQNGLSGSWTWHQSGTNLNGSDAYDAESSSPWSTGSSGSQSGPMSYSGVAGPTASFAVTAGGNVVMNGLDVHSTNRASTGNGSYTDTNWGYQNTSGGSESAYDADSVSGSQEKWWHDDFSSSHSVANSTATASITAGDNGAVTLNGGDAQYDVVSEHPALSASSDSIAAAGMTITTGNGPVTIGGAVTVSGASSAEVGLDVQNGNGNIDAGSAPISVTNAYDGGDGRATFQSGGDVHLDSVAVAGGHSAFLNATAGGSLQVDGASSATVTGGTSTGTAQIGLNGGTDVSAADITASSTHYLNSATLVYDHIPGNDDYDPDDVYNHTVDGGTASVSVQSTGGDVRLNGDVKANGYKTATIAAAATGSGKTLTTTVGKSVAATTSGATFISTSHDQYVSVPTYSAGVTLAGDGGLTIGSSVGATVTNHNGAATIGLTTTGGADAAITQDGSSVVKADGSSGSVTVHAGNAEPSTANAAAVALDGDVDAHGTSGTASVAIAGKSGSVHGFNATSDSNAASAGITAFDAAGTLTLNGSGAVSGNGNNANGAQLTVTGTGALDASGATLTVGNGNTGNAAGAQATLAANGGAAQLGALAVSTAGNGTAALHAASTGDLSTAGTLSATGSNGSASVTLTSSAGNVSLGNDVTATGGNGATAAATATAGTLYQSAGTVSAHTNTGIAAATLTSGGVMTVAGNVAATAVSGTANASLIGNAVPVDGDALTLNGNLTATSTSGAANAAATTTGGNTASIAQGADSVIQANGNTGNVAINAGNAVPDPSNAAALALAGNVKASGTGGTANVTINGASGTVHDFSAVSTGNAATVNVAGLDTGTLTLNGTGAVTANADSNTGAHLTVDGAGALDTTDATLTIGNQNTGATAGAQADLTAGNGDNTLGNVAVTGGNAAVLNASASGDVTAMQTLAATANAASGGAQVNLTSSGATVAVNAAAAVNATAGNAGGNATIDATGATGLTLDGALTATADGDATIGLGTTGGAGAAIAQGGGSTILANGNSATIDVDAGNSGNMPTAANTAAVALGGMLQAQAAAGGAAVTVNALSGTVHDFSVTSDSGDASATVNAYGGNLALDGNGSVIAGGNANAALTTQNGVLTVGDATHGIAVTSTGTGTEALLQANGNGGLNTNGALTATASNTDGYAAIDLGSASGNVALNADATALADDDANIDVTATSGTLTQAAGTTVRSGATNGVAEVAYTGGGAMAINGNVTAAATSDGTATGAHSGVGIVKLTTTGGPSASITQDAASTIAAVGDSARMTIIAGDSSPGQNPGNTAAFNLNGSLQALDTVDGAQLQIGGWSGAVHDFTVTGGNATASAVITTFGGDLALNGAGTVSANSDRADGASLTVDAAGSLDTSTAALTVGNDSTGASAGAQVRLQAMGGSAKLGPVAVTGNGDGAASLQGIAATTMTVTGNMSAAGMGLGAGNGSAAISLTTTGAGNALSTITQNAGTTIAATTTGNAGDATVDIQAGNCCNSAVALNGTVQAIVTGGTGDAGVAVRGSKVALKNVKADVVANGSGDALLDVAAPSEIQLKGALDVQAADSGKRADIKLISDRLTDGSTRITLSKGNGYVQLAPFSTGNIIGVDSSNDFDATIQTNYAAATLDKFIGQQAEITFGGQYDRSAWTTQACLPGMASWASQLQQTADIHVAGNGHLDLVDAKMVFDTTGTTYYHDLKMSPWSVPAGRLAVFVARPNIDRYLDRTDNTVQTLTRTVEESFNSNNVHTVTDATGPVPGASQIGSKLFLDGDGVNMVHTAAAESGSGNGNGDSGGAQPGATPGPVSGSDDGASDDSGKQAGNQSADEERRKHDGSEL